MLFRSDLEKFYKSPEYLSNASALNMRTKQLRNMYTMHIAVYLVTGEWCYPGKDGDEDNEFAVFLVDNQITKVEDLVTMDFEDFERFYGYKINPRYFRRLQALNYWMGHPPKGEKNYLLYERLVSISLDDFDAYIYKVWHPTNPPSASTQQNVPQQVTMDTPSQPTATATTGVIPTATPVAGINSKRMELLR